MRKLLDCLFGHRKLSVLVPLLLAGLFYLLFVFFGVSEAKVNAILAAPVLSVVWFFGAQFIVYIQVERLEQTGSDWFIDVFELLVTIAFGVYAIAGIWTFVASGWREFDIVVCLGLVTYSAMARVHNKRSKNLR